MFGGALLAASAHPRLPSMAVGGGACATGSVSFWKAAYSSLLLA